MQNKIFRLLISIALPLLVGFISSFFTMGSIDSWYTTLEKPFFNPPNSIFGPVWTLLYIMMGYAFYLVWEKKGKIDCSKEYILYFAQLILNFFWSILFFGMQNPSLALINILILWGVLLLNIIAFWKVDKRAGMLLIPYICWVSFATVLNMAIVLLN